MKATKVLPKSNKTSNRFGQSSLRSKSLEIVRPRTSGKCHHNFSTAVKCMPKLNVATLRNRLAHKIRLAVYEGGSSDTKRNAKLRQVSKQALEQGLDMETIQQTIKMCQHSNDEAKRFLLQIRAPSRVYLVCTVNTESLRELQNRLVHMLKKYNAGFAYVLNSFNNCGIIEAIVSHRMSVNFDYYEATLVKDATECACKGIEIVDYETGAVNFKCGSLELPDIANKLRSKGYTVLHITYGFKPKKFVLLEAHERAAYESLLSKLRKVPEIEHIYENVMEQKSDDSQK